MKPRKIASFAERLKTALSLRGISQAELSRRTGISKSNLSHYIKGDWEGKQDAVFSIAEALDINEAWLMGYDTSVERPSWEDYIHVAVEEKNSGRDAARDSMIQTHGEDHATHMVRVVGKKFALLLYRAFDSRDECSAASLIFNEVERMSAEELKRAMILLASYNDADDRTRQMVDLALEPYNPKDIM